jgi:6-phosphogluconate dehydrogenase (decarboxylating)
VRAFAWIAIAALAASTGSAANPEPGLDMLGFFTGRTHADNVIKIALHGPHKLVVDSIGGRNKEGQFVLIDTIQEEGKPVRKRVWVMHPAGANHFTGSLSDAIGPVDVTIGGDGASIRYTMKEGHLKVEQELKLQHDGSLANHAVARKFGIKFATVDGTVRKAG